MLDVLDVMCQCTLYSDEFRANPFHVEETFLFKSCDLTQHLRFP
jgi:hypothetical protein